MRLYHSSTFGRVSLFYGENRDELLLFHYGWLPTERGSYFILGVPILKLRLKLWRCPLRRFYGLYAEG